MSTARKKQGQEATERPDAEDGSVHPETRQRVKKDAVPGDESSKAAPTTQRDARGNHDRDGNQEQTGKVAGG